MSVRWRTEWRKPAAHNAAMRKLLAATIIGLAAGSAAAQVPVPAALRPDVLIGRLTADVVARLKGDAAAGRATDIALLVNTKILPVFDFAHMTRMAVARNWRLATAEQQAALVTQFRTLLVRSYSSALSSYRDEEIEYKPLRFAAGETDVLVRSVVRRRGAEPLTIDYDMELTPAGWMVYDVKIAGVSLVLNYRETFAAAVRADGIEGLIKSLSDKNYSNHLNLRRAASGNLAPLLLIYAGGRQRGG
jgi:phospholipid transport system substrate-binding protein